MTVDLSYIGTPLTISIVISCGVQTRQILGEGRSARYIWAPYIFGERTETGEGILVQTPNICGRDLAEHPMPDDFLPVVFWAPDAGNLEFMVAYLNEQAYDQPIAKLKFNRATFAPATKVDYDSWKLTEWKKNIVPLATRHDEYSKGHNFFQGGEFFPRSDRRSLHRLVFSPLACRAYLRVPIPESARSRIQAAWPVGKPHFWLGARSIQEELEKQYPQIFTGYRRLDPNWDREMPGALPSFYEGVGVNRASGLGHIVTNKLAVASGRGLRIPYRVSTGYPWASDRLLTDHMIDVHVDTKDGADHGFAYCFRDMYATYFHPDLNQPPTSVGQRFYIDNQLIGVWPKGQGSAPTPVIMEDDKYIWLADRSAFPLTHELARMQ
ncbi:hypothetical protein [Nitrobacter sp.]|uniref:hypothetical protein n=1 Tax=Nitrobacter sp. TaxID=29420 RepID=UPI00399D6CA7